MRTRKPKHSLPFWPSIVMKKWLNIKPKVHEFSEDEIDTETESEEDDSRSLGWNQVDKEQDDQYVGLEQEAEKTHNVQMPLKHRRGKSETLRVQYINSKDVRITVGTWNVAGRTPEEDLEIDEWLCTNEPADMYIIGFQEVVPLNAGNVLGAEDKKPIPIWEAIIRRTLNKSQQSKTEYKSYSAPPSPVTRTSGASDVLAEETGTPDNGIGTNKALGFTADGFKTRELNEVINLGRKFHMKRVYGIDGDSRLDWPEHPMDTPPQVLSSNPSLRRVMSFNWLEKPLVYAPKGPDLGSRLKRECRSSGNLELIWKQQENGCQDIDALSEASDQLSDDEEEEYSCAVKPEVHFEDNIDGESVKACKKYVRIVSKQMVGIYLSVWVRKRLRRHVNNLKVSPVGVGLMGYMGNKGSVSVSMTLFQSRLCFVCSHLTSGSKEGDQQRRNSDVYEILKRTRFCSVLNSNHPQTIPAHDQIFWFGDLNYRLNLLDSEVRRLVAGRQWTELSNSDQLVKELKAGCVFDGWMEGPIDFPPTYKYEINSDKYLGDEPKEGEKKRCPAWCDRILWLGKGIKQLSYDRAELWLSDHRPVRSTFVVEVEVFDQRKLQRALNFTTAKVLGDYFLDEPYHDL